METGNVIPVERADSASTQGRTDWPHRVLVVDDDIGARQLSAEVLIHSVVTRWTPPKTVLPIGRLFRSVR